LLIKYSKYKKNKIAILYYLSQNVLYIIFYLISKFLGKNYVSIILYHSVNEKNSYYSINLKKFFQQMEYLRKNYKIISIDDVIKFINGEIYFSKKCVAITFDDGYYDNYSIIYPYLMKFDIPATIFITSNYVGKEIKHNNKFIKMLSWNDIIKMMNIITIGSHTQTHPDLTKINYLMAKAELKNSKKQIERKINKKIHFIAYPFNRYNNKVIKLVKKCGYTNAFCGNGLIKKGQNPYEMNRIVIDQSINLILFKCQLTMAIELYIIFKKLIKKILNHFPKILIFIKNLEINKKYLI